MLRAALLQMLVAALFFARRLPAEGDGGLRVPLLFVLFAHRYAALGGAVAVCVATWAAVRAPKRAPEPARPPAAEEPAPADEHSALAAELRRALRSV
jgi:cytochrome c-type biogenesis protein CcmH/NrfG